MDKAEQNIAWIFLSRGLVKLFRLDLEYPREIESNVVAGSVYKCTDFVLHFTAWSKWRLRLYFTFVDCYFFNTNPPLFSIYLCRLCLLHVVFYICTMSMPRMISKHVHMIQFPVVISDFYILFCHLFSDLRSDQLSGRLWVSVRNSLRYIYIWVLLFVLD